MHYALWYTYSQGKNPDLNRRLDKAVSDFDIFLPETALKLFRDHIIFMKNWKTHASASSK